MKKYDIVVIGAGAGGLVVAIGSAKAGKKVLLIEKGHYGGDCTNFGCIPSKSLIAAAKYAHALKTADHLGIQPLKCAFTAQEAFKRVRQVIQEIRSHEDPQALKALGVKTLTAKAQFQDAQTVQAGQDTVTGKKIVIATGSHPFIPPIEGLEDTPYLTNETIFDLEAPPKSLLFVGGGPIGCELAQAFARLGSEVSLVESQLRILAREDGDARQVIQSAFEQDKISLHLGYRTQKVAYKNNLFTVTLKGKETRTLEVTHLFIGVGRRPTLENLKLERAGIQFTEQGIQTDAYGRTSQSHIFALGDAAGSPFFTHRAENQARTVLKNLLLPFHSKISTQPIPRCTYTDPEVASIGLSESEAKEKFSEKKVALYKIPFSEVDRNITMGRTEGFVKIITKKWSSHILGATIVGPRAGEMLMQISTAMMQKMPLRKFSKLIHPYPIQSLAIRKAADLYLTQTLLPNLQKWIGHK